MNQGTRLFFLGSLVILGILLIVGIVGYNFGSSQLIEESRNRLIQARLAKTNELSKDFESLNKSLLILADHPGIIDVTQGGQKSDQGKQGLPYELLRKIHRDFEIHNILIFDHKGVLQKSVRRISVKEGLPITKESMGLGIISALEWASKSTYLSSRFFDFQQSRNQNILPYAYIAAPVFIKGRNIGTILFQISLDRIESLLSNNHDWIRLGLKQTGEIVAFGPEGLLRVNPRVFYEDQNNIFRNHFQISPKFKINPAMRLGLPEGVIQEYIKKGEIEESTQDYLGRPSLQSIGKVRILDGPEWILVARMDQEEASVPVTKNLILLTSACLILLISGYFVATRFSRQMLHPLREISRSVSLFKSHSTKESDETVGDLQKVFENITSLTKGYGELQKSKDFLDKIMASLGEAVFIVSTPVLAKLQDARFNIVAMNLAACRMIGHEFANLKGQDLKMWVDTDYTFVRRSQSKSFDAALKKGDGSRIPLELSSSVFPTTDHSNYFYVIVGRDVSWKKEIEKELSVQEKLLQQSQSISKIGSFRWNLESGQLHWSEEQFKILGLNPLEIVPTYELFRDRILQEDLSIFDTSLQEAVEKKSTFQADFRIRRSDNHEISWIRAHGRFEEAAGADPTIMYGTHQDITEMRRVELSLISAKDEALKSSQAKSEFLARMSHEIRTPMNAIMGMAELLSETKLDENQTHYVDIFCKAGEVLMNLINDILDLSKIEAGEISIENIPLDLQKLMTDVEVMMQPRAQEKGLKYFFTISSEISTHIMGDPNKLRQILINLVGNALKFTKYGQVKVEIQKNPNRKSTLLLKVQDTGIGISQNKQHLIFQKFSQADSSITRRFGGTGLGLAISKSLVELMGGQIWFKSREKIGTTFYVTIPYHEALVSSETQPEALAKKPVAVPLKRKNYDHKLRILIADDTGDNRTLFTHFLKSEDFEILEAENGLEALEKVKKEDLDMVFMDVQMPEMDGYAATGEIRQWERTQHLDPIPIVALTAHALSEDRQKSLDAGCNDHIAKPFRKDTLLKIINRYSS